MSKNGRSNLLIILALLVGVSGASLDTYSAFFKYHQEIITPKIFLFFDLIENL